MPGPELAVGFAGDDVPMSGVPRLAATLGAAAAPGGVVWLAGAGVCARATLAPVARIMAETAAIRMGRMSNSF